MHVKLFKKIKKSNGSLDVLSEEDFEIFIHIASYANENGYLLWEEDDGSLTPMEIPPKIFKHLIDKGYLLPSHSLSPYPYRVNKIKIGSV